ncbi:MAG: NIPSNAP family protein [Acidimicrobiia bacterium]|nr:NIPSNAP family protein [Acidimicrobiia bacterium]NNL29107.1 NIPSNAP family containing protein [Acidimicrobiia bacterium]
MTAQLRIYDIEEGKLEEFARLVSDHVIPPRLQYGFEIVGTWTIPANNQYCWIVSYDGPLRWDEAVERYYNSPERRNLAFDPDEFITKADLRQLEPI